MLTLVFRLYTQLDLDISKNSTDSMRFDTKFSYTKFSYAVICFTFESISALLINNVCFSSTTSHFSSKKL